MKLMLSSQTIGAAERNLCTHFPRWLAMYRDATKECLAHTASKLGSVLCCGMSVSLIGIVTAQSQEFAVFGALVGESLDYSTNIRRITLRMQGQMNNFSTACNLGSTLISREFRKHSSN